MSLTAWLRVPLSVLGSVFFSFKGFWVAPGFFLEE